ncbi:MAG: hypothetical protein A2144_12850 [Chloroflexi bacterium RBG_16_50_9]|nr:MAG: hypothetical protein A2144_12850 [Chloroflexi bacterium RBG_16_50_9]
MRKTLLNQQRPDRQANHQESSLSGTEFIQPVKSGHDGNQPESDVISMLWHELLSPLTLIKGYTATMLQLNDVVTEEQRKHYLHGIESASNRMVRLLENLRDVSRLEETNYLATQTISLRDLLREVLSEVQNQTTKHFIRLRPHAPLPRIKADPERIAQVVNNLLVNAIKYSPEGGDIEVETRLFRSDSELKRMLGETPAVRLPCLVVSVADNGIGIPEGELDRIFEKFYRVNNKLTRAVPGVGLGLYMCKMIIEAHSGHIWARNRLNGGSVFSFSLPLG